VLQFNLGMMSHSAHVTFCHALMRPTLECDVITQRPLTV